MILATVILLGLLVLLAWAHWWPDTLPFNAWETTLKDSWLIISGVLLEIVDLLGADQSWSALIPGKYAPLVVIGIGALGIVLRRMNLDRS